MASRLSLLRLLVWLWPTTLLAASCGAQPGSEGEGVVASAPQGVMGADDQGDPAVVGILSDRGSTFGFCTGSLIGANLVLTARHCIAPNEGAIECGTAKFGTPDPASALWLTPDWNGPQLQMPYYKFDKGNWFRVAEVMLSPGEEMCGFDIALLRLQGSGVPPSLAQPIIPRIDIAPGVGETYRVVGFGSSGPGLSDFGRRRQLDNLSVACSGNCTSTKVDAQREWMGTTGECMGDSGGPALDAQNQVIGVLSRSYADCTMPVYGSVVVWGEWIKEQAVAAAHAGGYDPPVWAGGPDSGASGSAGSGGAAAAGGADGAGGQGEGGAGTSGTGAQSGSTGGETSADPAYRAPSADSGCVSARGGSSAPSSASTSILLACALLAAARNRRS
jgi:hypothetical protein